MTTYPRATPTSEPATRVGGHVIVPPTGGMLWCQANADLFLTLLAAPPDKDDAEAMEVYREAVDLGRDMCARQCVRFEECLQEAIEGPNIDGFVAGTTEVERRRHRRHLGVANAPEIVTDRFVGIDGTERRTHTDTDVLDEAIRRNPAASSSEIAEIVNCSASTVKRRRRHLDALAEKQAARAVAPIVHDHVETYYLLRETT